MRGTITGILFCFYDKVTSPFLALPMVKTPLLIIVLAIILKSVFYDTPVEQVSWLLKPTALLTGLFLSIPFEWIAGAGYMDPEGRYLITPECSGLSFLTISSIFIGLLLIRDRDKIKLPLYWGPVIIFACYLWTLLANTSRICGAIALERLKVSYPDLTSLGWLHYGEGLFVYFCFFLILNFIFLKLQRAFYHDHQ